jgi:tripartite-type tricarboxylate transporter receptor subunit TctC
MKRVALALLASIAGFAPAKAQDYPSKPIRMILPVLPGGAPDFVGRIVAERLSTRLNQKVIVDNRPGAGGIIGLELLKASPPNGYTIASVQSGPLTVSPFLQDNLSYDPLRDFTHITNLLKFPLLLVAHPSLPVNNVKELIALARARPGEITYASSGQGGTAHVTAELFNLMAKVKMARIQYKSIAPAIVAVLSGEAQLTYSNAPAIMPHVKSGRVRALGITSGQRSPFLPEIPSIAESGLAGYEAYGSAGMLGPPNMAKEILQRLNKETVAVLEQKEVMELMIPQGMLPAPCSPEEFTAFLKAELRKWGEVVKAANIKGE